MIKDEIKGSDVLKFGHQEINTGEEIFFAISTKHFKNFQFETKNQTNEMKSMAKGSNLSTRFILNTANRKLDFDAGFEKAYQSRAQNPGLITNSEIFVNAPYKPYGDFEIVVWMLLRIVINHKTEGEGSVQTQDSKPSISFIVTCYSENEEAYTEIDQKINSIIKEFERKIITRIILMRLNESREWPEDLTIIGGDFNAKFLKPKPIDKQKLNLTVNVKKDSVVVNKKIKKSKKSRIGKWAETLKKVESVDQSSPILPDQKALIPTNSPREESKVSISVTEAHEKDTIIREERQEVVDDQSQKFEIKLVAKYRFPSNINIKAIDNLSILKNLSVFNMKNVFVIKNNYKTYVFTLTDNNPEGKDLHRGAAKASILTSNNDMEKAVNKNTVYLKVYGISEPDEKFLKDIIKIIKDQIDQIALLERATNIYKSQPNFSDYEFVRERGEKLFLWYKVPKFIINYLGFLDEVRQNMKNYFIIVQMASTKCMDQAISIASSRQSASHLKKSFKNNMTRSSFYVHSNMFSSMTGERSEDLLEIYQHPREKTNKNRPIFEENEDYKSSMNEGTPLKQTILRMSPQILEEPKNIKENIILYMENYDSDDYTFLLNGFSSDINKNLDKKVKSKISKEQILMTTFGTCLATLCFGMNIGSNKEFKEKLKKYKFEDIFSIQGDKKKEEQKIKESQTNKAMSNINTEINSPKKLTLDGNKTIMRGLFDESSKQSLSKLEDF